MDGEARFDARPAVALLLPLSAAMVVLLLYTGAYAALRVSGVLVHQTYIRWQETPGAWPGEGYVEGHNIGRGSFFADDGRPAADPVTLGGRGIFFPLVKAEVLGWTAWEAVERWWYGQEGGGC